MTTNAPAGTTPGAVEISETVTPVRSRRTFKRSVIAIAIAATCGVTLAACGEDDSSAPVPKTTPVNGKVFPTPSPTEEPTEQPTSQPTDEPTQDPTDDPTDTEVLGTPIGPDGAYLQGVSYDSIDQPADAECQFLGDDGWSVTSCVTDKQQVAYVVEKRVNQGSVGWRANVLRYTSDQGWTAVIGYADDNGEEVSGINMLTTDLNNNGAKEGVFGFHHLGTGNVLAYDIVAGDTVLAHRGDLSHGAAKVNDHDITEVSAQYPNGEPNCCPAYLQRTQVSYEGDELTAYDSLRLDPASSTFTGNL